MKYFDWDEEKNAKLKVERDISFEDIVMAIDKGGLLDIIEHHNPDKHPHQKMFVVNIANYVYVAPFVEDEEKYFLKTIYPSRKLTKKYLFERRKT